MESVIGYEEKTPEIYEKITSGYPRFVKHEYIRKFLQHASFSTSQKGQALDICSPRALQELCDFSGIHAAEVQVDETPEDCLRIKIPADPEKCEQARLFLQHTGCGISSRQAEDWLIANGLKDTRFVESSSSTAGDLHIRTHLHKVYRTHSADDIYLCRGGMNAFFTAFKIIRDRQAEAGRQIWIQLGWLYVDTIKILEKFSARRARPVVFHKITDLENLEIFLSRNGRKVAGIVTEIPTNPLVQTCDLPRLHGLARKYGAALVLDPTIATPHNVNILPYSDAHINSLTKYAGNEGDIMIGALALNRQSPFYDSLKTAVETHRDKPYERDLRRLAVQVDHYGELVRKVNDNTCKVVEYLQQSPAVNDVFWAYHPDCSSHFDSIATGKNAPGGIVTVSLKKPLKSFYDRLMMAKSPSFGTRFTMCCPFMYLAHFDLVSSYFGRLMLEKAGLDPDLIRLAVGIEDSDRIIAVLEEALS